MAVVCFENRANRGTAAAISGVMVDTFIASHRRAPKRLVLDFDATDDRVHGQQAPEKQWCQGGAAPTNQLPHS